jgi:hypothetical protein
MFVLYFKIEIIKFYLNLDTLLVATNRFWLCQLLAWSYVRKSFRPPARQAGKTLVRPVFGRVKRELLSKPKAADDDDSRCPVEEASSAALPAAVS